MVWCASNLLAGAELEIDSDAMPKGEYLRRIPRNGRIISRDHFPPLHTFPCRCTGLPSVVLRPISLPPNQKLRLLLSYDFFRYILLIRAITSFKMIQRRTFDRRMLKNVKNHLD